jgi:hypothetical protein
MAILINSCPGGLNHGLIDRTDHSKILDARAADEP